MVRESCVSATPDFMHKKANKINQTKSISKKIFPNGYFNFTCPRLNIWRTYEKCLSKMWLEKTNMFAQNEKQNNLIEKTKKSKLNEISQLFFFFFFVTGLTVSVNIWIHTWIWSSCVQRIPRRFLSGKVPLCTTYCLFCKNFF